MSDIEIQINLDNNGADVRINSTKKALDRFSKSLTGLNRNIGRSERKISGLVHKMRDLFVILGQARGSLRTIWSITGQWTGAIILQNAELERMTALMVGLSREADRSKRQIEALTNVKFVLDFSTSAPFSVQSLTDSFVKLKTAGLDPAGGALRNLTDAVAAFGGDDAILKRASVALLQMSGKGVVSMEELRQQLGEAVPSAMKLMARSANLSMGEFVKLVSQGKVEATDALRRLSDEFAIVFGGRGADMMKTFNGQLAKLRVNMTLLSKGIGDAGFFPEIKKNLEDINEFLLSSDGKVFARNLGKSLTTVTKAFVEVAKSATALKDAVIFLTKAIGVLIGGKILGRLIGPLVIAGAKLLSVASAAGASTAAIGILRGAWLSFMAITPAGLVAGITTALWLGYEAWKAWGQAATNAMAVQAKLHQNNNKGILSSSATIGTLEGQIDRGQSALKAFLAATKFASPYDKDAGMRKAIDQLNEALGLQLSVTEDTTEDIIALTGNAIRGINRELGEAKQLRLQDFIDTTLPEKIEAQLGKVRDIQAQFANSLEASSSATNAGDQTSKQGAEQRKALFTGMLLRATGAFDEAIAIARDKLAQAEANGQEAVIEQISQEVDALVKEQEKFAALIGRKINDADVAAKLIEALDNKKADNFIKYLNGIKEKFNELSAKGVKASATLAEFRSRLEAGSFGVVKPEDIARMEEWIQKLDRAKAKVDLLADAEKSRDKIAEQLAKVRADVVTSQLELSGNVYSKVSSGMTAVNRLIAQQREHLDKAKQKYDQVGTSGALAFDIGALAQYAGKVAEINALFALLIKAAKQVDANKTAISFRKVADSARDAIGSLTEEGAAANFEGQRIELQKLADEYAALRAGSDEMTAEMFAAMDEYDKARALLLKKHVLENRTQIEVLIDDWSNITDEMENVWASAMQGMADTFMGFIETGKFALKDFVKDILKMIAEIAIQKALAGIVGSVMGAFTQSGQIQSGVNDVLGGDNMFAKGGVMSQYGKLPLNAYANGGVANKPQVAIFGEGRMNEAYVPLPDGKSIPVTMEGGSGGNVEINVINQSGQNVEAKEQGRRFDGKKMILDVILEASSRQGQFRDGMRTALK